MIYLDNKIIDEIKIGLKDKYDWTTIGYGNEPQYISDGYDYAVQMKEKWDNDTSVERDNYFANDDKVVFVPVLDFSKVQKLNATFRNCPNLLSMDYLDLKNITNVGGLFGGCPRLTEIKIKNTENVSNLNVCDERNFSLLKITPFSVKNMESMSIRNDFVREITLLNFGEFTGYGHYGLEANRWGLNIGNNNTAYESLINTFSNAFDRKTAGLQNFNIHIAPTPFVLLPHSLKKELNDKGYTFFNNKFYNNLDEKLRIEYTQDSTLPRDEYFQLGVAQEDFLTTIFAPNVNEYINFFSRVGNDIRYIKLPSAVTSIIKMPDLQYKSFKNSFSYCSLLKKIDLSSVNFSNVSDVTSMFSGCQRLEEINLSGFQHSNIYTNYNYMFRFCSSLKKIILNNCSCDTIKWIIDRLKETERIPTDIQIVSDTQCTDTRWVVTDGYICEGTTKYEKEIEEVSTDYQQTWTPTGQERRGQFAIQQNVTDCGGTDQPIIEVPFNITSNRIPFNFTVNKGESNERKIIVTESPFIKKLPELGISRKISFASAFASTNVANVILPTSACSTLEKAFERCFSAKSIDLSAVDVKFCRSFKNLFTSNSVLNEINLSNWNISTPASSLTDMFKYCRSLKTIKMIGCDQTTIDKIKAALTQSGIPDGQVTIVTA